MYKANTSEQFSVELAQEQRRKNQRHAGDPSYTPEALLELNGFGIAFGKRVILCDITLSIPEYGSTVLLGPSGTGKSTLLRTLAGLSSASPTFRTWGTAFYQGEILNEHERPVLVAQSAHLLMSSVLENIVVNLPERNQLTKPMQRDLAARLLEQADLPELCDKLNEPVANLSLALQRHLSILRLTAASPRLLCIDEPTTKLTDAESIRLLAYMQKEAKRRALLVILHNQQHARLLGGMAVLVAGGHVQEQQSIPQIFDAPVSIAARDFARNGTCTVASPGASPEELDESTPPPKPLPKAAMNYSGSSVGPRGFLWLTRNKIAGTPMPGVYFDTEYDLKALRQIGITTLVTLTENDLDQSLLESFGIKNIWEPIPDMEPPSIEQGIRICQKIEHQISQHEVLAVHCRAGLGRTGTILAAHLIWTGKSALDALEAVRSIEPRWVQSTAQVEFLELFDCALQTNIPEQGL